MRSPLSPGALLAVGAGGALGALARYGTALAIPPPPAGFPTATFLVNVVGAFVLGLLSAIPAARLALDGQTRALIGTGFCGGLTTFSTMSLEVATRWGQASALAVGYVVVSLLAAVAAVAAGRAVGVRAFRGAPPLPERSGDVPEPPGGPAGRAGPGLRP